MSQDGKSCVCVGGRGGREGGQVPLLVSLAGARLCLVCTGIYPGTPGIPSWAAPWQVGRNGGTGLGGAGPAAVAELLLYLWPSQKMKESSIDGLMKSLDKNSDQEIDFKEYSVFLTTLCMAYNDFFLEDNK